MTSQPPPFSPDPATRPDMDSIPRRQADAPQPPHRLVASAGARGEPPVDDLIWPLFLTDKAKPEPVAAMPGVVRQTVDSIVAEVRRARDLGIPAIALFPNTDPKLRDEVGSEALNPDNLVCRALRAIKAAVPRSASSPTWRSTPIPATAMTASCRARRSSTI